jgi:predicted RNA methylase
VLGVEILGNVYEQFLGKVIRLTAGHQAKVETKPEVKKAGGVYYTPQYIVDYIVKNTVGKLVEGKGKTPEEIAKIKILDPACGSGSFLIGAYTYLLRYHLDWYVGNEPKKHKEAVFRVRENEWYLTTAEKKRILLNNIFGVDIDPQAVEVTKLSLLLKVLEHESRESIDQQVKLGLEGVLPNLEDNIKCGNSLIGPDFYGTGQQETLFDEAEMRRVNVFDWDDDVKGFGGIMRRGGFDCVVGNPPYGAEISDNQRNYLESHFKLHNTDTACLFMGLATGILKNNGINGFIVPKPFVYSSNWDLIREKLLGELIEIVDCGKVWKHVKLEQIIYLFQKDKKVNSYRSCVRKEREIRYLGDINKETFKEFGFYLNGISSVELSIGEKIRNSGMSLNDFITNQRGAVYQKYVTQNESEFKVLGGKQIARYFTSGDVKGFIPEKIIDDDKAYIKDNSILVQRIVAHIQNPIPHIKITASLSKSLDISKYIIVDTINQLQNKSEFSSEFLISIGF